MVKQLILSPDQGIITVVQGKIALVIDEIISRALPGSIDAGNVMKIEAPVL